MQIVEEYTTENTVDIGDRMRTKINGGWKVVTMAMVITPLHSGYPYRVVVVYEREEKEKQELKKVIPVIYRMADNDAAKMGKKVCTECGHKMFIDEAWFYIWGPNGKEFYCFDCTQKILEDGKCEI